MSRNAARTGSLPMSSASHTIHTRADGTVWGVSSWNWANRLHNVRARRERETRRQLRTPAEVRRWAKRFPDVRPYEVEKAIAALSAQEVKP